MKTLYIDCGMGAAGDMLTAALLELFPQPEQIIEELNTLGIPHVRFSMEKSSKCGIIGTHVTVKVHGEEEGDHTHEHSHPVHQHVHEHSHNTLHGIEHILSHMNISEKIRTDVINVYQLIADAESKAHGVPVSEIHFHEVGNLDAVADVTAVCVLMDKLVPDKVVVSPIHVGSGQVHCAHGILPVPAPATAHILQGCPIYGGQIRGELCTPTGAALLKYFADDFGDMPVMNVSAIGYGMGKKDFDAANCVRIMLGETNFSKDVMYELNCNVDDMTAEQIGYALECCFKAGAVEAFTIPINMKKSRPGTLIRVLCTEEEKETLIQTIFKHTSTAGIREIKVHRSVLERKVIEENTPYGKIRRKDYSGYGVTRSKYEYEDLARIASENRLSIEELLKNIQG
ncbi:MAG: nickel pincer cofactor biosynthesis protein LarC [Lachnospiraceae bacterium]|nr:nickel pincer cofactor biosynthesis protein LarC [Lachnospiraceae bacterium]